jgi:hypothetical protein
MPIRILLAIAALSSLGAVGIMRPFSPALNGPLHDLRWMAGCLEMRSKDRLVEEQRMDVRGASMLGMARTTTPHGLGEYELTLIHEKGGVIVFEAHPGGQPSAEFKATSVSADSVIFAAPEHDYPQIVGYRRAGQDSVVAWIDGIASGRSRRVEFAYRRVSCPGRKRGGA